MGTYSIVDPGMIGKKIAYSTNAAFFNEKNGFTIEKRNRKSNVYVRISLVHNYVSGLTDLSIERGSLFDKKSYVKDIFKDIKRRLVNRCDIFWRKRLVKSALETF